MSDSGKPKINKILSEVAAWEPDATREDATRYFYLPPSMKDVLKGKIGVVSGRKGTGKTALFEYIRSKEEFNRRVIPLSFTNYTFSILYQLKDEAQRGASQYIVLWKYIIYSHVAAALCHEPEVETDFRRQIKAKFPIYTDQQIDAFIPNIKGSDLRVEIPNIIEVDSSENPIRDRANWGRAVEALEAAVLQNITGDVQYFIIFDGLDGDYRNIYKDTETASSIYSDYFDLVEGLIQAIYDIKTKFVRNKTDYVCPIAFVSSDIYQLISTRGRDGHKWDAIKIDIYWGKNEIEDLLSFRLGRAARRDAPLVPLARTWRTFFSDDPIHLKKPISIFDYILRRTLLRPRDFVTYLKMVAEVGARWKYDIIRPGVVVNTEKRYSDSFRAEHINEMSTAMPDIDIYLQALQRMRKAQFHEADFAEEFQEMSEQFVFKGPKEFTYKVALRSLFENSIIGMVDPENDTTIFKYTSPFATYNRDEELVIHAGLRASFDLSRPTRKKKNYAHVAPYIPPPESQLSLFDFGPKPSLMDKSVVDGVEPEED